MQMIPRVPLSTVWTQSLPGFKKVNIQVNNSIKMTSVVLLPDKDMTKVVGKRGTT